MLRTAVVMMTKLPIAGFCKNRLQEVIDAYESAEFQRLCIEELGATVRASGLPLHVYYASPDGGGSPETFFESWSGIRSLSPQRGGDLGERMHNAVRETLSDYEALIIIGSDLPDLESVVFEKVVIELEKSDLVLGPCKDGGYYLLAIKGDYPELFKGIDWSSHLVLEQTINKARETGLVYSLLDTRRDIDTWNDIIDYYDRNKGVSKTDTYAYTELLVNRHDSKRRGAGNGPKSKTPD